MVYTVRNRLMDAFVVHNELKDTIFLNNSLHGEDVITMNEKGYLELRDSINDGTYKLKGPFIGSVLAFVETSNKGNKRAYQTFLSPKKGAGERYDIGSKIFRDGSPFVDVNFVPFNQGYESNEQLKKGYSYKITLSNATEDLFYVEVVMEINRKKNDKESYELFSMITKTENEQFSAGNRSDWLFLNPRQVQMQDRLLKFTVDEDIQWLKLYVIVSDTPILFDGKDLIVCKQDSDCEATLARKTVFCSFKN